MFADAEADGVRSLPRALDNSNSSSITLLFQDLCDDFHHF